MQWVFSHALVSIVTAKMSFDNYSQKLVLNMHCPPISCMPKNIPGISWEMHHQGHGHNICLNLLHKCFFSNFQVPQ